MAIIRGSAGSDIINGTAFDDYIRGEAGDDEIYGFAGSDTIFGGDGNDVILDGNGADFIYGGDGNDSLNMATDSTADFVDGGAGIDFITYLTANGTTVVDFLDNSRNSGAAAGDTFVNVEGYLGSSGRDVVYGSNDNDRFLGSGGNDTYSGRGGFDLYFTADIGPATEVTIEIAFGARAANLAALAGIGAPSASQGVAYYEIWTDTNTNSIRDSGEVVVFADVLSSIEGFVGANGAETLRGSAANELFAPGFGADTVAGNGGFDTLSYYNAAAADQFGTGVTIDLVAGTAVSGRYNPSIFNYETATATISGIENFEGSDFNDQAQGAAGDNVFWGRAGNDALDGRGGEDWLFGGSGDDMLVGGAADDILDGGKGADVLIGGDGIDTASYVGAGTAVAVSLLRGKGLVPIINGVPVSNPDSSNDVLIGIENLIGSTFDDTLAGDDSANLIEGRAGRDGIQGCGGDDIIYGESAPNSPVEDYAPTPDLNDSTILDDCDCACDPESDDHDVAENYADFLLGGDGNDQIYGQLGDDELRGGDGKDRLYGGDGNDIIYGNADNDTIEGGLGTDFLYGGAGDDTISGGAGFDVIYGGTGIDTVSYAASPDGVNVNLSSFWNSGGDASTDLLAEMIGALSAGASASDIVLSAIFINLLESLDSTGSEVAFTLSIPDVIIGVESVTGSAYNDTLTGNSVQNVLRGGAGNDVINGAGGIDILYGNEGRDTFVFDSRLGSTNVDRLRDFSVADDTILLDQSIFTTLAVGQLSASAFYAGAAAHDADDRIIYNPANGYLYYDADGTGSTSAILFAILPTGLAMTNADFLIGP